MSFLADEDFDNNIIRGVRRRVPSLDLVRIQDLGGIGVRDEEVLALAANAGRLVLTHDVNTMIAAATARIAAGQRMPGLIVVSQRLGAGPVIDDIVLLVDCSCTGEWEDRIVFLPL